MAYEYNEYPGSYKIPDITEVHHALNYVEGI